MKPHLDFATLNLYLDDALPEPARLQVDAHLAQCDACRAELASLQIVAGAFDAWRNEPIPRDVSVAVMARVRQRPVPGARARWGIVALGAQAVLAVLLAAWVLPQLLQMVTGIRVPFGLPAWNWNAQLFAGPTLPDFAPALPTMALWMWGAVLAGAVILWFVSNRLLWRTLSREQEASQ